MLPVRKVHVIAMPSRLYQKTTRQVSHAGYSAKCHCAGHARIDCTTAVKVRTRAPAAQEQPKRFLVTHPVGTPS